MSDFAGKIVLFDFWTYTCVNCIRTLPYLKDWHEKYADEGLLVIGVHTPEFDFEKLHENVAAAVADLGVEYPVAQDNNRGTWQTYRVQAWPTKYIMDGQGFVRYYYRGEGAYADTERVIRFLLEEAGRDLSHIDPNSDPRPGTHSGHARYRHGEVSDKRTVRRNDSQHRLRRRIHTQRGVLQDARRRPRLHRSGRAQEPFPVHPRRVAEHAGEFAPRQDKC